MKIFKTLALIIVVGAITASCFDNDRDDNVILASEINDFVWKGMNAIYLYKDNVPDLANDRFSSDAEYGAYLNNFSTPEGLFESLIYQRETVDRFSWIVDDYIALEQLLSGISTNNGMEFSLFFAPNSNTEVFGAIRLILPNSEADNNNLKRGDIFYAIDGTPLTENNLSNLLNQDVYTLNLATFNDQGTPETTDDTIDPSGENITINKVPYTENPVFRTEIIDVDGENVGYLMYNGFTNEFDNQLNNAFGEFLTNNVQHLVIDLRYNPGGSVNTSVLLGSMVTGQFTGQVATKLIYNNDLQSFNTIFNFANTLTDGSSLNSLNLSKVYVITTDRSASASEGLINSLNPYIDVVQIGTTTVGKSQASITIYDSEGFGREGANPNHTYAMQPLVAIGVNKNDVVVPSSGITPTIILAENKFNYGVLGNENEPLLAAALAHIAGTGRVSYPVLHNHINPIGDSDDFLPFDIGMYIDVELPNEAVKRLEFNK
jgi:carboxyl-terminal processing protease